MENHTAKTAAVSEKEEAQDAVKAQETGAAAPAAGDSASVKPAESDSRTSYIKGNLSQDERETNCGFPQKTAWK